MMTHIIVILVTLFITHSSVNFVSSEDVLSDAELRFYHGETPYTYTEFKLSEATKLLKHPAFRINHPTIIYIHGWNEKMDEAETLLVIVKSYLSRKNHNVLALNYETLSKQFYSVIVENSKELAKRVADALMDLYYQGLELDQIHLMGFSVGAHICGEIGRAMLPYFPIPRITGFDPSHPMYYGTSEHVELNKYDAQFVDIIHTDAGIIGAPTSSGHADFYPNGGRRPQPRCGHSFWQFVSLAVGDHCAHDSAVYYYARSVIATKRIFVARNVLNPLDTAQMGYSCSNTALGDYYLKTD